MNMTEVLINYLRFSQRFGFIKGMVPYIKWKLKMTNDITFPGLPYPFTLRPNTSDSPTFGQVFVANQYEVKLGFKPKVIIDAGANIGLFSILMKSKYPDAMIICIEPDKDNFETLKHNLRKFDNVFFEHCGLWNTDTSLKISDKFNLGKWGVVVEEDLSSNGLKALSMDTILNKYNIERVDVLKIDIETSEKKLFSDNYDGWLPKIKVIIIELHDSMSSGCSRPFFAAIMKTFKSFRHALRVESTIIFNLDLNDS